MLASASLDNSVILWNVQKGKKHAMLSDYVKGFPQGVTWDPTNKYVATISSDRFVGVFCMIDYVIESALFVQLLRWFYVF